jgi:hypothetical protein
MHTILDSFSLALRDLRAPRVLAVLLIPPLAAFSRLGSPGVGVRGRLGALGGRLHRGQRLAHVDEQLRAHGTSSYGQAASRRWRRSCPSC